MDINKKEFVKYLLEKGVLITKEALGKINSKEQIDQLYNLDVNENYEVPGVFGDEFGKAPLKCGDLFV